MQVAIEVLAVRQREWEAADCPCASHNYVVFPYGLHVDWQGGVTGRANGTDGNLGMQCVVAGSGIECRIGQVVAVAGGDAAERVAHIDNPLCGHAVVPAHGEALVAVGRKADGVDAIWAGESTDAEIVHCRCHFIDSV